MQPYIYETIPHMTFFVADFPTADPNIPHRMVDLRANNMRTSKTGKTYWAKVDEAMDAFGEKVRIIKSRNNVKKIAQDFDLNPNNVKVHSRIDNSVLFTDDEKIIAIENAKLYSNYTEEYIAEEMIYHLEVIDCDVTNSRFYRYLKESFMSERRAEFLENNMLRLSVSQIVEVQKYLPDKNFAHRYDSSNGGNIFVRWEDPMWVTSEHSRKFTYSTP